MITKAVNVQTIFEFATAPFEGGSKASKQSSLLVINAIIGQHIENLKKKASAKEEMAHTDEDDDMIVQQNSDDENGDEADGTGAGTNNNAAIQALSSQLAELIGGK